MFFRRRLNRQAESVNRTTVDRFNTTYTIVDNAHRRRYSCCGAGYRRRLEWVQPPSRTTFGAVPIHLMGDFEEGSWFTDLQSPTQARIEAEWLSSASHFRGWAPIPIFTRIFFFCYCVFGGDNTQAIMETPLYS